ncbi:helix-hairpin-helix domain-containing protein [Proteiniclasticum sp. C24MP]|uniref:helix-hairpin-helix domain-containing protein n=1 Tax=Proteiniclasticum sp. C24MP TaxID=3374101 RepID=UPI003755215D
MNSIKRNRKDILSFVQKTIFCLGLAAASISFCACSRSNDDLFLNEETVEEISVVTKEEEPVQTIIVEIKGEVLAPGVYTMPGNSRLNDLLLASGGMTSYANLRNVNLAMRIEDGESFYIPSILEEEEEIVVGSQKQEEGKIDLNKATREELMSVTGIGPATADNILAYREEMGKFTSVDELVEVNRIGDKTLEKIRDYFIVK